MSYYYDRILSLEKKLFSQTTGKFFNFLPQHISYLIYLLGLKKDRVNKKIFLGNEMKILLPEGKDIFLYGFTSKPTDIKFCKYLIKTISKNSTFVDVGAQFGFFSLFVSIIMEEKVNVISIEPSKYNFNFLYQNLDKRKNVVLENKAVGKENKIIKFYESDQKKHRSKSAKRDFQNPLNIELMMLDSYFKAKNLNPSFIKINVKENIANIFEGLRNVLTMGSAEICFQYNKLVEPENMDKIINILIRYNYGIYKIDNEGELIKLKMKQAIDEQIGLDFENLIIRHSAK